MKIVLPIAAGGVVAIAAVAMSTGPGQFAFGALGLFIKPLGEEFGWDRAQVSLAATYFTITLAFSIPVIGQLADRYGSRLVCVTLHPGLCRLAGAACLVGRYPVETVSHLHPDGLPGRRRQCTAIFAHHRDLVRPAARTGNRHCHGG